MAECKRKASVCVKIIMEDVVDNNSNDNSIQYCNYNNSRDEGDKTTTKIEKDMYR